MGSSARNSGVSLVEVITAVAVLGIAIPPVLGMFTEIARRSPNDLYQSAAIHAGNSLMEEIISKSFEDPDLPQGSFGTEELLVEGYDDIDDFDGYTDSGSALGSATASTVADATAALLADTGRSPYAGITLSARVDNVTAANTDPTATEPDGTTEFKRVTVSASWAAGDGGEVLLKTLRTRLQEAATSTGPLDDMGSGGSGTAVSTQAFDMVLINTSTETLEITSFSVAADRPTPWLRAVGISQNFGPMYGAWWGYTQVPTGDLRPTFLPSSYLTIEPEGFVGARFLFWWSLSDGPITFTLTFSFSNGETSVLTVPMDWI